MCIAIGKFFTSEETASFMSNMFSNLNLTDIETCYKLFRSEVIKSVNLRENRFGFEPEVTAKISRYPKIRIYEIGISYYGRTYEEGKKMKITYKFTKICERCHKKYGTDYKTSKFCYACSDFTYHAHREKK